MGYTPFACYYDMKYREVPKYFWVLLLTICIPITGLLYVIGMYPIEMGALSLVACGCYLLLRIVDLYQGADLVYLCCISLFLVQNPYTGHILMPVSFGIFLVASWVSFAIAYQLPMVKAYIDSQDRTGRFPMMLPISLALILTVVIA
jgi:hypothetical protein